ncbi:glycosyltransferase [Microbacterium hibisci]|uniref:glycosyltransferase n=1 Tax=Microbacterium hibisci TaxID=2036000 RepID=UPI00194382B8|nr:nucleotide disphospho-sugar-binding domain-containing protein [Microbacterium hibisci]
MRILLTGPPLHGHMTPLVAVGSALRVAGHDVHVLCTSEFVASAEERGLTAHLYRAAWSADEFSVPRVDVASRRAHTVFDAYQKSAASHFSDLVARILPGVVVADTVASYVRDRAGSAQTAWLSPTAVSHEVVATPVVAGRRQPVLVALAPFLQAHAAQLPAHVHLIGTEPPRGPEPAASRSRLLVSAGTSFNDDLTLFVDAATAVDGTDLHAVIATGSREASTRLERRLPRADVRAWVDQATELSRAAVFVTAGGAGSIQQAVLLGTPLIVVAQSHEQRGYGAAIEAAGVGVVLDPARVTPDVLTRRIQRLRSSRRVREALRARAAEIRALDFAGCAVRVVEEAAA